ncbi:MAG: SUMF1/EgtB/PvdO family nonheme iron enzyme [Acidobacteriota bacterium]
MIRVQSFLVVLVLVLAGPMVLGQEKGFTVEATPQEVLEDQLGIGERYALLIGISKYANATIDLSFAENDAQSLYDLLLDPEIGAYKKENIRLLVDENATRKNIMSSLNSWLGNRVREEDSVLIFYSGHGALGNGNEAYWVTHDADVEDLYASALSNKDISQLIANLSAKRKLTLIDSCFSEATAKKYRALVPSDIFEEFQGEGVVTITASTGQEKSVEVGGHGAFTHHLLEALEGQGDSNGNGVVELDELWNYLNVKVQKTAADAGNKQTPVLLADRLEHGFPVTINPSKAAGATLNLLKAMYTDGKIRLEEIGEAEQLLTQRGADPELRKLYQDLANGVLTPDYFRRLRSIHRPVDSTPSPPLVQAAVSPTTSSDSMPEAISVTRTSKDGVTEVERTEDGSAAESNTEEIEAYRVSELLNTPEAWQRFLDQYPNSNLATQARSRVMEFEFERRAEAMAYDIAKAGDNEEGWRQYLNRFPAGTYVDEANVRLEQLREARVRKDREPAAFILAESQNSEEGWANFVREFPQSQLAVLAQTRLEALRKLNREGENALYAQALEQDTPTVWDQYIQEYPDGRFLSEAMEKRTTAVKRVEETDQYQLAANTDTVAGWETYLGKFTDTPNAENARIRIRQLTWADFADVAPIPGGTFMMGDARGDGDSKPPHRVQLDPFHMGRAEVTNAQFSTFLEESNRRAPAAAKFVGNYMNSQLGHPVVNITYADAAAFCTWLSEKIGTTVRLPSEAEWEYSARGGQAGAKYPWGSTDPKKQARYNDNDPSGLKTVGMEAFAPNGFGLYNMSGNVAEWVNDYYSNKYYKTSPAKNPTGPARSKERVVRGGSWKTGKDHLEVSRRKKREPHKTDEAMGFRVVIEGLPQ